MISVAPLINILKVVLMKAVLPIGLGLVMLSLVATLARPFLTKPPSKGAEEVIVEHQNEAAKRVQKCDVILAGDSSCLMNVAADRLQRMGAVLNLGTLSIMPLSSFGQLVAAHRAGNPGQPEYVVLLIHPEMLSSESSSEGSTTLSGDPTENEDEKSMRRDVLTFTGILPAFEAGLGRFVPAGLPGRYGSFYGFAGTLRDYLREHRGSAIDPTPINPTKYSPQEYGFSAAFRGEAEKFRGLIPADCKLLVGLSPIPKSAAPEKYEEWRQTTLAELATLLKADGILHTPGILPAQVLATATHLRLEYTDNFAEKLEREFLRVSGEKRPEQ